MPQFIQPIKARLPRIHSREDLDDGSISESTAVHDSERGLSKMGQCNRSASSGLASDLILI
jgi:hypothetical protein